MSGSRILKDTIAILIPVHNSLPFTQKCLDDLHRKLQEVNDAETEFKPVVVDDGSTDSTASWIRENHPDVILLQGDGNLWWSGAVNVGARYALDTLHASYLLLWNNDIQVCDDYFISLVELIKNTGKDTIIGSKIFCDPGFTKVWSMGGKFDPYSGIKYMIGHYADDCAAFQEVTEVDWLAGMGTLVPAEIVRDIGLWDEKRFPQYYGDADFTYRARLKGYHVNIYPGLKIVNEIDNSGIKKIEHFRDLIPVLTQIKSVHHVGKNFLFYRLYAKSPRAYWQFFLIYYYFFGGFLKRKVRGLFSREKKS